MRAVPVTSPLTSRFTSLDSELIRPAKLPVTSTSFQSSDWSMALAPTPPRKSQAPFTEPSMSTEPLKARLASSVPPKLFCTCSKAEAVTGPENSM